MKTSRMWAGLLVGTATCLGALALSATDVDAQAQGVVAGKLAAKKAKYRRDAVVYLEPLGTKPAAKPRRETMDQRNHQFVPKVLPVAKGSTVRFLNSDNEAHNVFSPDNETYDLGNWGKGDHRDRRFTRPGTYTQLCRLHPSMIGYVVVLETPYFGAVSADGSFRIDGVPPGSYEVHVWHERAKSAVQKIAVAAGQTVEVELPMKRGRSR